MEDLPTILERALRLTGAARNEYLNGVCQGNPASRQQIESMIEAAAKAQAFFGETDSVSIEGETNASREGSKAPEGLLAEPNGPPPKKTIVLSMPFTEKPGDKV